MRWPLPTIAQLSWPLLSLSADKLRRTAPAGRSRRVDHAQSNYISDSRDRGQLQPSLCGCAIQAPWQPHPSQRPTCAPFVLLLRRTKSPMRRRYRPLNPRECSHRARAGAAGCTNAAPVAPRSTTCNRWRWPTIATLAQAAAGGFKPLAAAGRKPVCILIPESATWPTTLPAMDTAGKQAPPSRKRSSVAASSALIAPSPRARSHRPNSSSRSTWRRDRRRPAHSSIVCWSRTHDGIERPAHGTGDAR